MKIELEVKEVMDIQEGKKVGKIVDIVERKEPYHYIDFILSMEGSDKLTLKYGVPAGLSTKSKLGRLYEKFGGKLESGKTVDVYKIFSGKEVEYITMNEETDRGVFARVVDGSLKPRVR